MFIDDVDEWLRLDKAADILFDGVYHAGMDFVGLSSNMRRDDDVFKLPEMKDSFDPRAHHLHPAQVLARPYLLRGDIADQGIGVTDLL